MLPLLLFNDTSNLSRDMNERRVCRKVRNCLSRLRCRFALWYNRGLINYTRVLNPPGRKEKRKSIGKCVCLCVYIREKESKRKWKWMEYRRVEENVEKRVGRRREGSGWLRTWRRSRARERGWRWRNYIETKTSRTAKGNNQLFDLFT